MNKLKFELKYLINRFSWLGILNSPFKPFKVGFYAGKIAIGVPYFFPRKWIKNPDKSGYLKAVPKKIGFDFVLSSASPDLS